MAKMIYRGEGLVYYNVPFPQNGFLYIEIMLFNKEIDHEKLKRVLYDFTINIVVGKFKRLQELILQMYDYNTFCDLVTISQLEYATKVSVKYPDEFSYICFQDIERLIVILRNKFRNTEFYIGWSNNNIIEEGNERKFASVRYYNQCDVSNITNDSKDIKARAYKSDFYELLEDGSVSCTTYWYKVGR